MHLHVTPNDSPVNNYDDWQQQLLQTILLPERLEISFINAKKDIQLLKE